MSRCWICRAEPATSAFWLSASKVASFSSPFSTRLFRDWNSRTAWAVMGP